MKKNHTSVQLKKIMHARSLKQVDILKLAEPFSAKYGERITKTDLSQYVSGKTEPGQRKLFILSKALNVNPAWLMGLDVPMIEEETQKKNDTITDIILRLRQDALFLDVVNGLASLSPEQIQVVKATVGALKQQQVDHID